MRFASCRRCLLRDGRSCIVLEAQGADLIVQVRTMSDGKIQRRDETVAAADVERDVEAAVGDRVFYIAGGDRRVATVVGNNADGTHDLVLCGDENAAHEANHALGWASGEELHGVAGAAIELDTSFSTKDTSFSATLLRRAPPTHPSAHSGRMPPRSS